MRIAWMSAVPPFAFMVACSSVELRDQPCPDAFPEADPIATTIRIRNDSGTTIFIPDDCPDARPDGVSLDGVRFLDGSTLWACEDVAAGDCASVATPSCHGGGPYQLTSGNAIDVAWDGLVRQATRIPPSCVETCANEVTFASLDCGLAVAPSPGEHTLSLAFSRGSPGAPVELVETIVTFPTTELELVVGP